MSSATTTATAKKVKATKANPPEWHEVIIIGSGFGGLGAAIRLRQAGVKDVVILERYSDVGGTWRDNTYPGAACDIPSHLYSYSFAQNPNWSRAYSGSGEILGYVHDLVARFNLAPAIRFQNTVTEARFDEATASWRVITAEGAELSARHIIMASGGLANPSLPKINGIEQFAGKTIHSARWDHDYDFAGKRVAVIGTGASAVQLIPELVKVADKVTVFQRTAGWILPRMDYQAPGWHKTLFKRLPRAQSLMRRALFWGHESMAFSFIWSTPMTRMVERISTAFLRHQVKDKWLRRQLTPDFTIGCKRVLMTSNYYPALQKPNCKLITWPIATISPKGIRTAEGIEHQVDCIVFATGFDICKTGTPFKVTGVGGRVLAEEWTRGAQAYKSVNVSGYPNLSIILGPNSGPGHNSALVYMESQIGYIVNAITTAQRKSWGVMDVRPEVQKAYNVSIQKRLAKTNWNSGCKSWYLTEAGFNATMYPGFATQYARQMTDFQVKHYRTEVIR
jgi:cation diffusion facilitator CzcD-associated flavoprotein CzcO